MPAKSKPDHPTKAVPVTRPGSNPVWGDDEPMELPVAAKHAGIPFNTFRQKVYSRQIESVKLGRHRKVKPSAIRAYAQRNTLSAI